MVLDIGWGDIFQNLSGAMAVILLRILFFKWGWFFIYSHRDILSKIPKERSQEHLSVVNVETNLNLLL